MDRFAFDVRWKYAAGGLGFDYPGFVHTVLMDTRARSAASEQPRRIFEATLDATGRAGRGAARCWNRPRYDAVATMDTVTPIRSAGPRAARRRRSGAGVCGRCCAAMTTTPRRASRCVTTTTRRRGAGGSRPATRGRCSRACTVASKRTRPAPPPQQAHDRGFSLLVAAVNVARLGVLDSSQPPPKPGQWSPAEPRRQRPEPPPAGPQGPRCAVPLRRRDRHPLSRPPRRAPSPQPAVDTSNPDGPTLTRFLKLA